MPRMLSPLPSTALPRLDDRGIEYCIIRVLERYHGCCQHAEGIFAETSLPEQSPLLCSSGRSSPQHHSSHSSQAAIFEPQGTQPGPPTTRSPTSSLTPAYRRHRRKGSENSKKWNVVRRGTVRKRSIKTLLLQLQHYSSCCAAMIRSSSAWGSLYTANRQCRPSSRLSSALLDKYKCFKSNRCC